jgi:hypothetical protein
MVNKDMKIKWERNSRVLDLINSGKIDHEDMIPKTSTDNFPDGMATVRLSRVRDKKPFVTLHIKGQTKQANNSQYAHQPQHQWDYAYTLRVNMGGSYNNMMCPNGELDDTLTWLDVHNVVTKVKEIMGL